MNNNTKWRKLLIWLRKEFPINYKIKVQCKDRPRKGFEKCFGVCIQLDNSDIIIEINKNQNFSLKIDTLIHEWAHAMSIDSNNRNDHGNDWGIAYSKIYRKFLEWNFGRKNDD